MDRAICISIAVFCFPGRSCWGEVVGWIGCVGLVDWVGEGMMGGGMEGMRGGWGIDADARIHRDVIMCMSTLLLQSCFL